MKTGNRDKSAASKTNRVLSILGTLALLSGVAGCETADHGSSARQPNIPNPSVARVESVPQSEETTEAESVSELETDKEPGDSTDAGERVLPIGDAASLLNEIPIKGRAPKTGYARSEFGVRWKDIDRNGCDQRNDILDRDLVEKTYDDVSNNCVVLSGVLNDPFTATQISFVRGESTSSEVQIDHVVALSDAWQKGAQQLSFDTREQFANDPLNLLAVAGFANAQKSDGDAATWLPANKAFRCDYVARQVAVKYKYNLWVTQAEHDAIVNVLQGCPNQEVPSSDVKPEVLVADPQTDPIPASPEADDISLLEEDVYYANCSAVRDAGRAPLLAGEPGYRAGLDRDRDGVACE